MGKKIMSLVLCALFIIAVSGCKKTNPEKQVSMTESSASDTVSEASSASESSSPSESSSASETGAVIETSSAVSETSGATSETGSIIVENAPEYLKKESGDISALGSKIKDAAMTTCTALTESGNKFSIKLPDKVKVKFTAAKGKNGSTKYNILFDNILAGECFFNNRELPENTEQLSAEPETITGTVDVNKLILKYKGKASSWEVPVYQIYVRQQRGQQYAMIYFRQDMFPQDKIIEMARWLDFGYLPEVSRAGEKDYSKQSCRILILGNSFLASSQIGEILQYMANDNKVNLKVDVDCRANANLGHFSSDPTVLQKLADGIYDIVFLCGFYNNMNAQLEKMLEAKSDSTQLVIFPAHNESFEVPYTTRTLYPETGIADWKGFINKLIDMGIDYSRMCYDDGPKHSTYLAGYAGACILYSYLYKKTPEKGTAEGMVISEQTSNYGIPQGQVIDELGMIRKAAYDYLYN